MPAERRALAIVNPATGTVSVQRVRRVLSAAARRADVALEFKETERPDHATELVDQYADSVDLVVAVGGDGTLSEVVAAAVGRDIEVGIVTTGSTNMVAKDLGIPRLLGPAARVALSSRTSVIVDVARANGGAFIHMGGAGYDAAIMREASRRLKRILRWVAYVGPAIQHLRAKPFPARLCIDGWSIETKARMILFAIGGSIVHPRLVVGEGIDRTDGVLDVIVFDPPRFFDIMTTFAWVLLRRPGKSRWQHHYRGQWARVESSVPVPYEFDGSYRGELPVEVEMLPDGVRVIVPSLPTPGEIQAHLRARQDWSRTEYSITGQRTPL